jgi:YidC/Oxa1 family membrane protein insertase
MLSFLQEYTSAQKLVNKKYDLIFYAENAYYFQYYRHLFEHVIQEGISVCYITSDRTDPVLQLVQPGLEAVYIKSTLAFVFPRLKAKAMIMTMPDLQNFIFKRSPEVKKYIYVFHALVSVHQQYRAHAFDHYDTIFCAGPHHVEEMNETVKRYELPQKELIAYGYPLLDELKRRAKDSTVENKLLVAPSWYDEGIFNTCIEPLIEALELIGQKIVLRPHPEYIKRNKKSFKNLEARFSRKQDLSFDREPSLMQSMLAGSLLITDRSGIAFEYAFSKERPVLFIDTPLKMQNREAAGYNNQPVENRYRSWIGLAVAPNEISMIAEKITTLEENHSAYLHQIKEVKEQMVFDQSHHQAGIEYIMKLVRS